MESMRKEDAMAARIRVGTASWTDHESFYPAEYAKASMKSQRISYYARYFSLVEVDSTFYTLQHTATGAQFPAVGRPHTRRLHLRREGVWRVDVAPP